MRHGNVRFAAEQAVGGATPAVQQDRVHIATIRTGGGQALVLAVVADGEAHRQGGDAADLAVREIFGFVARSRGRSIAVTLREALEQAGRTLLESGATWEGKARVAATVAAIAGGRLYLASTGHTRAYRIRGGHASPLTHPDSGILGGPAPPSVWTSEKDGMPLQPGDQIVLASDGLTQLSPEDGRPYVEPSELGRYVEGNPPLEAARHLVSMALGRDAADNVSVAVLQVSGRPGSRQRTALLSVGALGVIVLLALAAVYLADLLPADTSPATSDFGYAVIVEGTALVSAEGQAAEARAELATIPSGARMTAQQPLRLSLQTTFAGPADLSSLSYYLEQGAVATLSALDLRGDDGSAAGETLVTLGYGRLLMARSGGARPALVEVGGVTAGFDGAGFGVLGAARMMDATVIDCLMGRCTVESAAGEAITVEAPARAEVRDGDVQWQGATPAAVVASWNALCAGCLSSR